MIEQNLPEAEEHFHKARKVYVEGLGPRHIRGVYPLLGLAKLELKRPLEEGGPDYDVMIAHIEKVRHTKGADTGTDRWTQPSANHQLQQPSRRPNAGGGQPETTRAGRQALH